MRRCLVMCGKGFVYERVPHVTLKSIASNPDIREGMSWEEVNAAIARHAETEILYDRPYNDNRKVRVAGRFTVESLSPPQGDLTRPPGLGVRPPTRRMSRLSSGRSSTTCSRLACRTAARRSGWSSRRSTPFPGEAHPG